MNKNSKILIVGHGDIIDKSLYRYFKKNNYTGVFWSHEFGLDTTIQPSVYNFFAKHRPEYVILTSVKSGGIEANQKFPADFIYHNLESQNNVIYSAAKFKAKKLLFISSSCVYPKECPQPMKPEYLFQSPMEKTSEAYSMAKLAGIILCQAYRKQYDLNAVVMIPATVYGPNSDMDLRHAHVLGAMMNKFKLAAENNSKVELWGTGKPRREFLYEDDFVSACLFLLEKYDGDKIINAGIGLDVSIKDLAEIIKKQVGFNGEVVFDTSKPDGAMQKLLDSSELLKMGWSPKVSLEQGVEEIYKTLAEA